MCERVRKHARICFVIFLLLIYFSLCQGGDGVHVFVCSVFHFFLHFFHSTNQKLFEANIKWFRFLFLNTFLLRYRFVSDLHGSADVVWCCCHAFGSGAGVASCFLLSLHLSPPLIISQSYASMHLFPLVYTFYKCLNNYAIFHMSLSTTISYSHTRTHREREKERDKHSQYAC